MPVFNVFFRDCMCEYLMSMKVKLCFKCVFFFVFVLVVVCLVAEKLWERKGKFGI
jgi:hypothetical protein